MFLSSVHTYTTRRLYPGMQKTWFDFLKPEATRGYLETHVILVQNLSLEVFFVFVLPRMSSMYGWQQGFRRGIIK